MYSNKSKIIATGVISLTLLAASPVFADTNVRSDSGLHIGVLTQLLGSREDRADTREALVNARQDLRASLKDDHTSSSSASTSKQFAIDGKVTAISGSVLTVQGARGAVYTISTTNASITGRAGATIPFSSIKVGDKVTVKGSLSGSIIVATKVHDRSDLTNVVFRSVEAGIVTAINGSLVTLSNFGSSGTSTVTTNGATKYSVNGSATSSSALSVGSHVLVLGTSTAANSTLNASLVVILTDGFNWLKHLWK